MKKINALSYNYMAFYNYVYKIPKMIGIRHFFDNKNLMKEVLGRNN